MDKSLAAALKKAKMLIEDKNYEEAVDTLEVLIAQNAKSPDARLLLGLAFQKSNFLDKAQVQYTRVLGLRPDDFNAIWSLSKISKSKGKLVEQAEYLKQALPLFKAKGNVQRYSEGIRALVQNYRQRNLEDQIRLLFQQLDNQQTQLSPLVAEMFCNAARRQIQAKTFDLDLDFLTRKELSPLARPQVNRFLHEVILYCRNSDQLRYSQDKIGILVLNLRNRFPWSNILLYHLLTEPSCLSLEEERQYLVQECVDLLVGGYLKEKSEFYSYYASSKFGNLFIQNQLFLKSIELAKLYLAFINTFHQDMLTPYPWLPLFIEQLRAESVFDEPGRDFSLFRDQLADHVLQLPLKIKQLQSANQPCEKQLIAFKRRIASLGKEGINVSMFEYLLALLGVNEFKQLHEMQSFKNTLKERIKRGAGNADTYRSLYLYLLKSAQNFRVFDQQISIDDICKNILKEDPLSAQFLFVQFWAQFSTSKDAKPLTALKEVAQSRGPEAVAKYLCLELVSGVINCLLSQAEIRLRATQLAALSPNDYRHKVTLATCLFVEGEYSESLSAAKQAFKMHSKDYNLVQLLFLCLVKCGDTEGAFSLLKSVYGGYSQVFWVNNALANLLIGKQKYGEAQVYATRAAQNYRVSATRDYRVYYEKDLQTDGAYGVPYLVHQNKVQLLEQYLVLGQQVLLKEAAYLSRQFYRTDVDRREIHLWLKVAEVYKNLGKLQSGLKCLKDQEPVFNRLVTQSVELRPSDFSEALLKLFYGGQLKFDNRINLGLQDWPLLAQHRLLSATLHFYLGEYSEAHRYAFECLVVSQNLQNRSLLAEVLAVLIQMVYAHLLQLQKTENQEVIARAIQNFAPLLSFKTDSRAYFRSKFQLLVLKSLIVKTRESSQECTQLARQYLLDKGIDIQGLMTGKSIQASALEGVEQVIAEEVIEDLLVLRIRDQHLRVTKEQVLNLLQYYPRNAFLFSLYGCLETNVQAKKGAFLKSLQIDKQFTFALDQLGFIFLKSKNYTEAVKLFLKSCEIDVVATRPLYGLAAALFAVGVQFPSSQPLSQLVLKSALEKVSSYLLNIRSESSGFQQALLSVLLQLFVVRDPLVEKYYFNSYTVQSVNLNSEKYPLLQRLLERLRHRRLAQVPAKGCRPRELAILLDELTLKSLEGLQPTAQQLRLLDEADQTIASQSIASGFIQLPLSRCLKQLFFSTRSYYYHALYQSLHSIETAIPASQQFFFKAVEQLHAGDSDWRTTLSSSLLRDPSNRQARCLLDLALQRQHTHCQRSECYNFRLLARKDFRSFSLYNQGRGLVQLLNRNWRSFQSASLEKYLDKYPGVWMIQCYQTAGPQLREKLYDKISAVQSLRTMFHSTSSFTLESKVEQIQDTLKKIVLLSTLHSKVGTNNHARILALLENLGPELEDIELLRLRLDLIDLGKPPIQLIQSKETLGQSFARLVANLVNRKFKDLEADLQQLPQIQNEQTTTLICVFQVIYVYQVYLEDIQNEDNLATFQAYYDAMQETELPAMFRAMLFYMKGVVRLVSAQGSGLDKSKLLQPFKLAVLAYPPFAKQIIPKLCS